MFLGGRQELQEKVVQLQRARDSLEAELAALQAQVDQERASRHQETDRQQELESRRQVLATELERAKERETTHQVHPPSVLSPALVIRKSFLFCI